MEMLKKSWYKKWWGMAMIVLLAIVLAYALYFVFLTAKYVRMIQKGELAGFGEQGHFSSAGQTDGGSNSAGLNREDAMRLLVTSDDPSLGEKDAPLTIVEFAEFQCEYSKEVYSVAREIFSMYPGKIRLIYRDFPLAEIHPVALKAAEAGECADEQGKFWQLHDKLFEHQEELSEDSLVRFAIQAGVDERRFAQCLKSGKYAQEVREDMEAGRMLGVKGTPTFFFNGVKVGGSIPKEKFVEIVELFLKVEKR